MAKQFPRTEVAGVSLPRMLIGTNWLLGYSHKTTSMDAFIKDRYSTRDSFLPVFEAYLEYGIDAVMGPLTQAPVIYDAVHYAREKLGRDLIVIDTPILNMDDTREGRAEAEATVKECARNGSKFCLIHHSSAEQLVNKNKGTMDRLDDYTAMIRDAGMIPGLSAHMPELVLYSDENGYDLETYIQIYNCLGFLMQIEVETVASIINHAKKPVMTIKSMAAGRCTPYVGLNFVWNTIRPQDMVTMGCFTPAEVHEDVEISLAALEHRFPDLERRSSPNQNQAVLANK
ncbi:hypothetical protein LJC63_11560 [Ruminococcaceae bacterium OttesenSCG-928-L11]|nr:hypothetical protein [Ruminococcaceae bacterium OttesenSCG-928-L11]